MSSLVRQHKENLGLAISSESVRNESAVAQDKIRFLKQLVADLQREMESLHQSQHRQSSRA
jgi:hypothetical protein